jgi:protein arginine kinase activator
MNCQECNQRHATLHFTKIVNGEKTEVHMCEKCAQEKGETFINQAGQGFSLNYLLAGLLNVESGLQQKKTAAFHQTEEVRCKHCNLSFKEFIHVSKFGCANCYETFKDHLNPILKRVHSGNTAHNGKIPKRIGGNIHIRKQITDLKQQMKEHIVNEEFELAAEIRDQIHSLERGNVAQGGEQV